MRLINIDDKSRYIRVLVGDYEVDIWGFTVKRTFIVAQGVCQE